MVKKKSELTKENIIDVSKNLFYEKGFEKTSLRQIAQKCGIQQSLVYYYFESKEALGAHIMAEFASKVNHCLHQYVSYNENPLLFMLTYVRMLIKEVSKDPKELDFYSEIFYSRSSNRPFVHEVHAVMKWYLQDVLLPFEHVQIAHIISDATWAGLIQAKKRGEIDLSLKAILDQVDRERYLYIGVPKQVLEELIVEAEQLVSTIPVHDFHIID